MKEKFQLALVVLIFDVLSIPLLPFRPRSNTPNAINHNLDPPSRFGQLDTHNEFNRPSNCIDCTVLGVRPDHFRGAFLSLVEAKGVAGLGKAGGDGTGGADKAGTQVPPEVYNALTYAGTAFLFTLSVPLILYGLNKLLNKIEDCFGCGPASKKKRISERQLENQQLFEKQANSNKLNDSSLVGGNLRQQYSKNGHHRSITSKNYHHLLDQQQQQQPQPQMDNQFPQVACFPANKGPLHSRTNSHSRSRQDSPAVPASTTTDSIGITAHHDHSNQQDFKKHRSTPTVPTATSALQNNYNQSAAPYIISSPHI